LRAVKELVVLTGEGRWGLGCHGEYVREAWLDEVSEDKDVR
jgi:hypothetical protein